MVKTTAELLREAKQSQREKRLQWIKDSIAGRDLIATTLSTPNEILKSQVLRDAVLGRACYYRDQQAMVKRISNDRFTDCDSLFDAAASPEDGRFPADLTCWKLIVCDGRLFEEDNSLQDAYEAQLLEEESNTLAERAKEVVRRETEKIARRNARWFIPILERLSSEELKQIDLEYGNATFKIWKQVSPAPPAWIQQIADAEQPWGFTFYKTRNIEQEYGHRWAKTWEILREQLRVIPYASWDERSLFFASLGSIHHQGNKSEVMRLWTEDWQAGPIAGDMVADNAVREHFKGYRKSLSSPSILQNTFIVVDTEPISEHFDEVVRNPHPNFFVWAYDADWDYSSSLLTKDTAVDGEEYNGRVKVSIFSLDAWFYAARYEGVNLRDMWLKSQSHPHQLWVCYSKPLEEWHHEPYI